MNFGGEAKGAAPASSIKISLQILSCIFSRYYLKEPFNDKESGFDAKL